MAVAQTGSMSAEAFFDWLAQQSERYELVEGRPVRMMAGARQSHNVVTSNILIALASDAKRSGCRTTASDTAVLTGPFSVRYPDVVVDCSPPDAQAKYASHPTVVVEVSSAGTLVTDLTDKLDEYQSHDAVQLILLIEPDVLSVKVYRRDKKSNWSVERYDRLDQSVDVSEIGASLSLTDVYDTLNPMPRPHLQIVDRRSS